MEGKLLRVAVAPRRGDRKTAEKLLEKAWQEASESESEPLSQGCILFCRREFSINPHFQFSRVCVP